MPPSLSLSFSPSLTPSLTLHKTRLINPHSTVLATPTSPVLPEYQSSDGIDRRVAGLLIAAPNEWNWGKVEEGGGEGREANDSIGEGDVELINVCCLGSVTTLMLIEF